MARLLRSTITKTRFSNRKTLFPQIQNLIHQNPVSELNPSFHFLLSRNYISQMRKSAFDEKILRLLRNEIQYEFDGAPKQPVAKFKSFMVDERPGEQWITMKRKYGENEEIKVEATMFDGAFPNLKSIDVTKDNDLQLHITFVVNIFKGDDDFLEIIGSAWPDSMEIRKLFIRKGQSTTGKTYDGPDFTELDDELQDSLYDFLEARGVDDELAAFLHEYMRNKEKIEYIRWMGTVKSYIEK